MSYNYNVFQGLWRVRKKTREGDNALNAVPIQQQRQIFSFQLLFVAAMFMLFGASSIFAQTTIINPTGDGGFETGASFQENGWTLANDDVDQWYVGNVQNQASGTKGAYISNTNGKSHAYSIQNPSQVSFFYRDVTVPAGETKITLSFKWKNVGQNTSLINQDKIVVYVAPTTLTPIASQVPTGAVELTGTTLAAALVYNAEYKTETFSLPKSYAGTTFRLIFGYKVSTSTTNPGLMPGAIDNISLVSQVPTTVKSIASGNWSDPTIWDSGTVPQSENVVIDTGHTVKIDMAGDTSTATSSTTTDIMPGSASTNNLTINGTLTFGEAPAPAAGGLVKGSGLQIFGNLIVNAGGNFNMYYLGSLSATTKVYTAFSVSGNVTNNGQMDIYGSDMILWSSNVQTVDGTGLYTNINSLMPTYTSTPTMYVNNLRLRNSNIATPNIQWNLDAYVLNILEMRQARVNLGSKVMTLSGVFNASPFTEDAGFTSGSTFKRFWSATNSGFTGIPTVANQELTTSGSGTTGKYPFVSAKGENRSVYLMRLNNGAAIAGEIGVKYTDATTVTTGLNVADGTSVITNRFDGNWTITDGGVGPATYRIAIQAPGVLNTAPALANSAVRIMGANNVFGTYLPGTKLPTAIRDKVTSAELTAGPLYLGAAASDLIPAATVISKASGNWNDTATWLNNQVPTSNDIVTIADGNTVTVNSAGNVCKNLTIAAGGTLSNVSGDLTIGTTLNNNIFINSGTLNVSGGTLKINGSSIHNSLSTFIQSGGDIIVDGNDGTTANSVATGVAMMKISATKPGNLQWTGGTLTFVDPHAGSASINGGNPEYVLNILQYGDYNSASRNHIVKFGDGTSTTPAGSPEGFRYSLKPDTGSTTAPFRLGSVIVDTGNDNTYRMVKPNASASVSIGFEGDLTINSGIMVFPNASTNYMINGNLVNNGTLINPGILYMGMQKAYYNQTATNGAGTLTYYDAPCPNPQSISGTGKFLCTLGVPVAETQGINTTTCLTINNSSAAGVTLNVPLTIVNNGTVNGYLTLMQGKLNTTNTNLLTLGTPGVEGKWSPGSPQYLGNYDTYVNGPLAMYVARSNTPTNYAFFPIGKSKFLPFSIAPTTAATFPLAYVKAEAFESNLGTTDATCSNLASVRWETTSSVPFGISNVKLGDANIVSGMIPVQSTSASGVYTGAFGNTSKFTTTAPNTIESQVSSVANNYFSYSKLAACSGTPVAGSASINGNVNSFTVGYNSPIELGLTNAVLYDGQTYQWEGSADNVTYTSISGLTTALAYTKQNDAFSYYRCKVTCGGTTAISSPIAVPVVANITWVSSGSNSGTVQVSSPICPGSSAFINNLGVFNSATSYCALYDSAEGSGTPIVFNNTNNILGTGPLTATTTFYVAVIDKATGKSSKRVPVTVQVSTVPNAPTAVSQTFCNSATVATIANLTTTSGTGIKWYDAATAGNLLASTAALSTGTYYAAQTPAGCESTSRTPVTVTVIDAPTVTSPQGVCNSGTVANLVATGSNLKWYSASANGIQWASTDPLVAGTYYVSQTVGGCETKRTQVNVTIGSSTPVAPTGTAAQPFCVTAAPTLASLVTTPTTGIKWYDAATGGNLIPTTTAIPVGSTDYYASQTVSGCESTARLKVTATVNVVDAPIATSPQTFCGFYGLVTSIAASPNPSTATATFKYYSVPTGGTAITNGGPSNGTTYYVSQTINSCESAVRTPVLVNFSNPSPPTVSSQKLCNNPNAPTLADAMPYVTLAVPGNTIKWYTTGSSSTSLPLTTTLVANTSYYAAEVTSSGCESTARGTFSVPSNNPFDTTIPSAPTVFAAESFTAGSTVANLSAIGTGIKWYNASTGGTPLAATAPLVDGASYYATQTTSSCESPRALVVATLGATLPGAPQANSPQMFCNNPSLPQVSNLVATGDANSTIKWYLTPTGGQSLALVSTANINSQVYYYASQVVNGAESVLRTPVLVYVNSVSSVPPTAPAVQSFCSSTATVDDLVANGTGIKWYSTVSGTTGLIAPGTLLATGTYYPTQTYNGCETGSSITRNAVNVTVSPSTTVTAAPTGSATPTVCYGSTLANLPVTGSNILWYDAPTGGSLLPSTTTAVSGTSYYASQTSGCESALRLKVIPTVGSIIAAPTAVASQTICAGSNLTASGVLSTIKWYTSATGTALAPTPLVTGTYYAADSDGTCESAVRTAVTVSVVSVSPPTAAATQNFCSSSATVANLVANGPGIKWYDAATGGNLVLPSATLINGNKYYPSQTNGTCETPSATTKTAVTVNVTTALTSPTPAATQTVCFAAGTPATMSNLIPQPGSALNWYSSSTGGTALASGLTLTSGTYYATTVSNGCESARVSSIVTVAAKPAAPFVSSISQPTCTVATGSTMLTGLPATGTWTISNTTPTVTTVTTGTGTSTTINGIAPAGKTFTVTDANGCVSATTAFTINSQPVAPTATAVKTQPTCAVSTGSVALSNLPSGVWTINPGNIVSSATTQTFTALTTGTYNYTLTGAGGCTQPISAVINAQPTPPTVPVAGTVTQPTCTALGSVALSGLPATGNWIINPGAIAGSGATYTVTGLAAGTNNFTVTNAADLTCISPATATVTINAQPTTLVQPTFGAVTQPTCTTATGSFAISNYNAAYTYAFTPTTGATNNAGAVTATAGTYSVIATSGVCTSVASANAVVNAQPVTPVQPVFGTVTQPTCTTATGSFAISNYDATYTYAFTPSLGVSRTAGAVTAPAGAYTVTATLGACTSAASASTTVNAQPATPVQPVLGSVTQPTCTTATGSFAISNYNAAYTYAFSPSTGATNNAGTVTAAAGTYTVTATLGSCTSVASANALVNAQQVTAAPTGASPQLFNTGAKISDIAVTLSTGGTVQWYASSNDAAANVNVLAPTTALVIGQTYYAVQTVNGCRSAASLAVMITDNLAVSQFDVVKMKFYPNPVIDVLNIIHTDVISSIEVFNLLGQRVLSARPDAASTKIDMSDLPIGTYLLEVQSQGKMTTVKVVKNQ